MFLPACSSASIPWCALTPVRRPSRALCEHRLSTLQIIPSRDVKVAGLLGPASPLEKKGMSVAETPVGLGGTTQW